MNKFFLDLGKQPLANNFLFKYKINQPKYGLKLFFNTKTKLVSISKRIPSRVMFNNQYPYKSSMSFTMRDSFKKLAVEIKKNFKPKLLLEIGSNDGALIKNFDKNKVLGVEPCDNLAKITKKLGYITYSKYWNKTTASLLKKRYKKIDLIYSANTLTHISNLTEVFNSINSILDKNGILIIEDPSLLECFKKNSYDQFYNEHIYVFSAIALSNILKKFNFQIFDIKNLKTHGGSLRYYIKKKDNKKIKIKNSVNIQLKKEISFGLSNFSTYQNFAIRANSSKNKLISLLNYYKNNKKIIVGYGATAKATTVLNYCNIKDELIKYFVDTTPEKQNKYMPGTKIKILKYHKKKILAADIVFLGAWNFKEEIFNKEKKFIKKGGKFLTHIPYPRII